MVFRRCLCLGNIRLLFLRRLSFLFLYPFFSLVCCIYIYFFLFFALFFDMFSRSVFFSRCLLRRHRCRFYSRRRCRFFFLFLCIFHLLSSSRAEVDVFFFRIFGFSFPRQLVQYLSFLPLVLFTFLFTSACEPNVSLPLSLSLYVWCRSMPPSNAVVRTTTENSVLCDVVLNAKDFRFVVFFSTSSIFLLLLFAFSVFRLSFSFGYYFAWHIVHWSRGRCHRHRRQCHAKQQMLFTMLMCSVPFGLLASLASLAFLAILTLFIFFILSHPSHPHSHSFRFRSPSLLFVFRCAWYITAITPSQRCISSIPFTIRRCPPLCAAVAVAATVAP